MQYFSAQSAVRIFVRRDVLFLKRDSLTGTTIPRFTYDTPTEPQLDFYALCEDDRPLVMVLLPNYGHPISRVYLTHYCETLAQLHTGRLACVVRSDPKKIAQNLQEEYPFTLICDAGGVLYNHFGVQASASRFVWSLAAARIFREAKRQGYVLEKGTAQQLPLTLVVGRGGEVLFSHYGQSLTDMPEDCAAMEKVCAHLMAGIAVPADDAEYDADYAEDEPKNGDAPAQAPADRTGNEDVLFPGQPVPERKPAQEAAADHTQPIDLGAWRGDAPLAAEEDMATPLEAGQEPAAEDANNQKWNKLLGLFSDGSAMPGKKG